MIRDSSSSDENCSLEIYVCNGKACSGLANFDGGYSFVEHVTSVAAPSRRVRWPLIALALPRSDEIVRAFIQPKSK